jgi:hypothetical protein
MLVVIATIKVYLIIVSEFSKDLRKDVFDEQKNVI